MKAGPGRERFICAIVGACLTTPPLIDLTSSDLHVLPPPGAVDRETVEEVFACDVAVDAAAEEASVDCGLSRFGCDVTVN